MTAPNFAERWRLLRLTARRGGRGRGTPPAPGLGWTLPVPPVEEFLFVPSDLRTPDPGVAGEFRLGRLGFGGEVVHIHRQSPFQVTGASAAWLDQLHGFSWLRDLAASEGPEALEQARQLTADWLALCGRPQAARRSPAWAPEVLGRRIISWMSHSGFLLDGSDAKFFRAVTSSLGTQLRALAATWRNARPGLPQLQCLVALLLADLTIAGRDKALERDEALLLAEIGQQILADGGHISRNSDAVLDLALDLLPLRRCYTAREVEPPAALVDAVGRMLGFLQTMRLGNGTLARFNGVGASRSDLLATLMTFDTRDGPLPSELPGSGYVRMERGKTVLLMDCGAAPALELAGRAQAGCLAFEMSDGTRALLINGGYPGPGRQSDRPNARATASHNTLTVNAQSSARFVTSPAITRLCGDAALAGPGLVTCRFMQLNGELDPEINGELNGAHAFEATHDGYEATNQLIHRRRLELSPDGTRLEGQDRLGPRHGVLRLGRDVPFAIHFHLAPGVTPEIEATARTNCVRLAVPGLPGWRLTATGAELVIEASPRYDTAGPSLARQVVLRGSCAGEATVEWTLERLPALE